MADCIQSSLATAVQVPGTDPGSSQSFIRRVVDKSKRQRLNEHEKAPSSLSTTCLVLESGLEVSFGDTQGASVTLDKIPQHVKELAAEEVN